MVSQPTQFILCGLPFSGKTTLGKALAEKLGFAHVNLDTIKKEKGLGSVSDDDISDDAWKEMFEEADRRLIQFLKKGKHVANETAWVTREWRDRARSIAAKEGFETNVIFVHVPESTYRVRWKKNRLNKQRYDTYDEEFEGYVRDFEPPSGDEHVIVYDQLKPLDEWLIQFKQQLS